MSFKTIYKVLTNDMIYMFYEFAYVFTFDTCSRLRNLEFLASSNLFWNSH